MWHRLIPRISRSAPQSFLAIIALAGLTFVCFRLQLNISTVGFLYLIVIVLLSLVGDYVSSVVTSLIAAVCLAYFFAPPIFSIRVTETVNIVAIIAFLTTSLVISRLVSEVRTTSEKLRLSECYLSEGQRLAHTGSWAFDATGFGYWSPGLFQVYGLDPHGKPPTVEEYLALVHPEDRAFMKQGIAKMLDDHLAFDFTKRIVRPDGEIRRIRCVGVPVTQGGIFQGFFGTGMDVTEQEQLTQELQRREAYLADAQRLSQTGSFGWKPDSGEIVWSDETYRIFEYDPAVKPTIDLVAQRVHPCDRTLVQQVIDRASQTGTDFEHEYRLLLADGRVKHVHAIAHALHDASGNREFVGAVTDITERKRAEDALRASENNLRQIVDSVPGLLCALSPAGKIELANRPLLEYFGKTNEELNRWSTTDVVHPDDLQRVIDAFTSSMANGTPFDDELRYRRADGVYRWFHVSILPVRDTNGAITGWYGVITDIEDRKRAEEKIRRLVDANILGIFIWNLEGAIVGANEAFLRLVQYGREDLASGRVRWSDLTPAEWRDCDERALTELKGTGTVQPYEKEYFRKDGSRVPVLIGAALFQGGGNEGVGFVLDLSEQKRAQESLRNSEAYLAEAQRLSQTGSWAWSPDEDIKYWSEECYRVLSFDPQDGLPRFEDFFQRIHPDDQPGFRELIQTAIREKAEWEADYRIVHPDGPVRDIHVVGHPVLSTSGHLVEFVGTVIDVTERKRAEEERERLRQLEADLAHVNRVSTLGEMAASLAHEIKQPIAAAITSANSCMEWLAHEPPNLDRARAAAARIDKYGNRAVEIIDRIRSLYKKSPPQRELVDINGIIHEMLTLLKGEVDRYPVAMRTDLSAELPKIMADRVQLQQVFMNLVLNAIEAMKDSGGELTVKSQLQDGQLQFSVSDTGVGLPKEKMDQIFSAFFTTKPQGSGMGLAISRSIVESHGGRLWATANDGRGATFHFTLPTQMSDTSPLVA